MKKFEFFNIQSWDLSFSACAKRLQMCLRHRKIIVSQTDKDIDTGTFEHHFGRIVCNYVVKRVKLGS